MHRRTALTVSAALLAAAPLLTACGSDAHPGAAAVVGGERIEVSSLQAQVKDVRAAQASSEQSAELLRSTGDLGRQKLSALIIDRIIEKVAADNGITATRADIQQTRTAYTRENGGEERFEAILLQQRGVAPDQIDGFIRHEVLMLKIAEKLGFTDSAEGQKKRTDVYSAASAALAIDVNPRYGAWDSSRGGLTAATTPWLRQVSQDPAAVEAGA
ncbi:SurA N-terminal domain-containing protein [Streptomyces sp. NPDC051180]|uniref:SurA N-terminal domain-containing protein n=1 Tax=unclassified Streptomyces TaxID=2593676 RepID=UPI00344F57EA